MPTLRFHEILSLLDPLYDSWLDLYQTAFSLDEQALVSEHNQALRRRANGDPTGERFLAVLRSENQIGEGDGLVGMARFDVIETAKEPVACLWYLAVTPEARSEGVGSQTYQEIVRLLREGNEDVPLLFLEVDDPEIAPSAESRELALRRIAFYRRNGARMLTGICYIQSVGWQPAIPMALMVQSVSPDTAPLDATDASAVFDSAKSVFGESLEQIGPLVLE